MEIRGYLLGGDKGHLLGGNKGHLLGGGEGHLLGGDKQHLRQTDHRCGQYLPTNVPAIMDKCCPKSPKYLCSNSFPVFDNMRSNGIRNQHLYIRIHLNCCVFATIKRGKTEV